MKILPYVYVCIHKETGKFYIGSRLSNKIPAHDDLGKVYKTSSKYVKPIFDKFYYYVLAEFFHADDAWKFEQKLISENKNNPKIINISHFSEGSLCFHTVGRKRTQEEKDKISKNKKGKKRKPFTRRKKPRELKWFMCQKCGKLWSVSLVVGYNGAGLIRRFCSYVCSNRYRRTLVGKTYK